MNPAVGSIYSLMVFGGLVAVFLGVTKALFGWEAVPSDNRIHATLMMLWYVVAAYYAMLVGRHREVHFFEALRRGGIDLGRAIRKQVMR